MSLAEEIPTGEQERPIDRAIAEEVLQRDPFPHLLVPDLLSREQRAAMARHWPQEADFTTYSDGHQRKLGEAGRFGLYIMGSAAGAATDRLTPASLRYWRERGAPLMRDAATALYRRYLPALRLRFGAALPELELETFAVLVNCYRRIEVRVHTDHPSFLYTAMLYLNAGARESAGTSLYTPRQTGFRHEGCGFLERDDFERVRTLPFRDNQLVSFLKTDNSFHGVEPQPLAAATERCTINMHVRLTDACIARLYGTETARCFRERISGRTPVAADALQRWQTLADLSGTPATEAEMRPLLDSFRIGDRQL